MALTRVQPSGVDQTKDYSVNKLTVSGVDVLGYAQSAFLQANTVYTYANTLSPVDSFARTQANASFIQANAAFTKANTGGASGLIYKSSATTPSTANIGDQWYSTTEDILYQYLSDGSSNAWVDISSSAVITDAAAVASAGVKISSLTYPNSATAANPAGSETITVTGSGFNTGAKVYVDTTLCNTTYVGATSLTFVSPAKSVSSYHLFVYNTDGSNGVMPIGMVYSSVPSWVTASGELTSAPINSTYSQSVSATGDGTITYSLSSGSLPSGLSLNTSNGAITGTAPNTAGTSTFSITATDSQNQTTSRSFSIAVVNNTPIEYLIVAGGGAGGAGGPSTAGGAGGGAGGLLYISGVEVTPGTTFTVTVGAGGTAGAGTGTNTNGDGNNGSNSAFNSSTTIGGGGGRAAEANYPDGLAGKNGGSGGGATAYYTTVGGGGIGTAGPPRQGYNGGTGASGWGGAGAGGGAGAAGGNGASGTTGSISPSGGIGYQSSITGTATYYAGGGGSGNYSQTAGAGGNGGGGAGATGSNTATAGSPNTGGGGGGGGGQSTVPAGTGGSGVVIIRYPDSYAAAASTTGSPTVTNPTGYRVYKFTSSGTITF